MDHVRDLIAARVRAEPVPPRMVVIDLSAAPYVDLQSAYTLANFRAGARGKNVFVEGWVRNAFDTFYILTAFPSLGLTPSGFIGETGAPRTFGIRAGVTF